MRLFVTGGGGFIGSNFIKYVLKHKENLIDIIHSPLKYKPITSNPVKDFANKHLKLYEDISNRR